MKKIAFLGNCQVDVYRRILAASETDFEFKSVEIWRHKPEEFGKISDSLLDYDVIVTQPLAVQYGPLATEALRSSAKALLTIHNIHFKGYLPDCDYVGPMGGRKKSPVGDYHSWVIHDLWARGKSLDEAVAAVREYPAARVREIFDKSAIELRNREAHIDVPVTQFVLDPYTGWELFFTFNHPTIKLHRMYLQSIMDALAVRMKVQIIKDPLLEHTQWSIYPSVVKALGLPSEADKGITFTASKSIGGSTYDLPQFCEMCFRCYGKTEAR